MPEEQITDTAGADAASREKMRLIDCFMEVIGYTRYLLKEIENRPPQFETVYHHYKTLLDRSMEKGRLAKFSNVEWKKGCFPVCAWVDEMILCSNWEEKDKWRSRQLQLRYFKTTNAGQIFFSRLEQLKEKEKYIREVYLYCLSLGFKGKLFNEGDELHLAEIKTDTLLALFPEDEAMNLPEALFPEAYIQQRSRKKGWKKGVSPLLLLVLIVPPVLIAVLYVFFNIHLGLLADNFTNSLQSRRLIIENRPPVLPATNVDSEKSPAARSDDE